MRTMTGLVLAVALSACGTPVQDPDMHPASPVESSARALGALQTRDYKVTWLTGDRVAVQDARGVTLASGVTVADLEKIDPFLYVACMNAVAKNGTYLDARLDRPVADDHHTR